MYKRIFLSVNSFRGREKGGGGAEQTKKHKKKARIYVSMCKSYLIQL